MDDLASLAEVRYGQLGGVKVLSRDREDNLKDKTKRRVVEREGIKV